MATTKNEAESTLDAPSETAAQPVSNQPISNQPISKVTTSPLRCWSGAFIALSIAMVTYRMVVAIATAFARTPVTSTNPTVMAISSAVRTLVLGIVALGAGVFGLIGVGLVLLGFQLVIQKFTQKDAQA
jgi:Protein of unknown function (DUF3082)